FSVLQLRNIQMRSWLKVSCVALGSALALSAVDAAAAPSTHRVVNLGIPTVVSPTPVLRLAGIPTVVSPTPVLRLAGIPTVVSPKPALRPAGLSAVGRRPRAS